MLEILRGDELSGIDIANINSPSQVVVSGLKEDIGRAGAFFKTAVVVPLNVSGAFHSRYMEKAKSDFELFVKNFGFSPLKIPVISNVTARPYKFENIEKLLLEQITHSVRWNESKRCRSSAKTDEHCLCLGRIHGLRTSRKTR